jgi:hypothetical protein
VNWMWYHVLENDKMSDVCYLTKKKVLFLPAIKKPTTFLYKSYKKVRLIG